jgi:hypothetical protein
MRMTKSSQSRRMPSHTGAPSGSFFRRAPSLMHDKGSLPCARQKTHDKDPLPGKYLSCSLCHAFLRKTHGEGVYFLTFAAAYSRSDRLVVGVNVMGEKILADIK